MMGDRIKNTAQDVSGKAKEAAGKVTDNEDLEREGITDQAEAELRQAVEDVSDPDRDN